jgi:predicted nucleic acid-binding protein
MLYLDTSALVKKYVQEPRSAEVLGWISREHMIATSAISRVEAAAAFSEAARIGSLTSSTAEACRRAFGREWKNYVRIRVTEALVARADDMAWTFGLRGYDAVHLASALEWHDRLGETVTLATFDQELWAAAADVGLERFPSAL